MSHPVPDFAGNVPAGRMGFKGHAAHRSARRGVGEANYLTP